MSSNVAGELLRNDEHRAIGGGKGAILIPFCQWEIGGELAGVFVGCSAHDIFEGHVAGAQLHEMGFFGGGVGFGEVRADPPLRHTVKRFSGVAESSSRTGKPFHRMAEPFSGTGNPSCHTAEWFCRTGEPSSHTGKPFCHTAESFCRTREPSCHTGKPFYRAEESFCRTRESFCHANKLPIFARKW